MSLVCERPYGTNKEPVDVHNGVAFPTYGREFGKYVNARLIGGHFPQQQPIGFDVDGAVHRQQIRIAEIQRARRTDRHTCQTGTHQKKQIPTIKQRERKTVVDEYTSQQLSHACVWIVWCG